MERGGRERGGGHWPHSVYLLIYFHSLFSLYRLYDTLGSPNLITLVGFTRVHLTATMMVGLIFGSKVKYYSYFMLG